MISRLLCFRSVLSVVPLLIALALASCTQNVTQIVNENCAPPPPPPCAPGTFTETKLDTLYHGTGRSQNHITLVPSPYSTDAQDIAIAYFESGGQQLAIVTSTRTAPDGSASSQADRLWAFLAKTGRSVPIEGLDSVGSIGALCFSPSDRRIYFSAHSPLPDPDDYDLYSARAEYNGTSLIISDVRPLSALNEPDKFDSQPAVDAKGTTLIFVSDRPGGIAGTDLWISRRTSVSEPWSPPSLLEGPVNSPCDELSPSFGPDNKLYFASNGHATVGGYDLFSSTYSHGTFGEPENLGKPINTEFDELFPVKRTDTSLYWSSNRLTGPALRNIFTITRTSIGDFAVNPTIEPKKPIIEHIDSLPAGPVDLYVDVTRGKDSIPAAGTELFIRHDTTELYRAKSPTSGKFKIKLKRDVYDVGAETKESFFDVKHVDLRTLPDSTMHIALNLPDTLVLRINFPFDDYQHPYEFVIDDAGRASTMTWRQALDLTAQSTLQSLKSLKKLIVIGHTDSLGTDAYNDKLGLHRAQFVASELVKRGVPERLISVSSRGRMQPVDMRPGETDEEFRLRSRRVEFVKVF